MGKNCIKRVCSIRLIPLLRRYMTIVCDNPAGTEYCT